MLRKSRRDTRLVIENPFGHCGWATVPILSTAGEMPHYSARGNRRALPPPPSQLRMSVEPHMMRWRTFTDRLIVLAVILAAWQLGSFFVGPYWLSSPWAVA